MKNCYTRPCQCSHTILGRVWILREYMYYEFVLSNTKQKKEMLSSNDRLHFRKSASITKGLRQLAKLKSNGLTKKHTKNNPCKVIVTVFTPTKRRFDPPNIYPTIKAILDGFTDAGVWDDDNHEIIKSLTFRYGGLSNVKEKYRIAIEILEMETHDYY
ncbi:phage Holliday junction resolvase [Streptococcus pyogenes]|nr:phage Holliday junction resolvase [Streptococcus pyogenes]VGW59174.1 phage Holliday junction resolvase [Streptococcus pyogenes]VHE56198.1 phage Holliday junction resolvase [Streptococcus pyogenes]VHG08199.1 phage Holliday junction resolvase [Streptococcus pyogenes]VHG11462.1 phage Holliday junction resolvase [Streptococcus pyogenes]